VTVVTQDSVCGRINRALALRQSRWRQPPSVTGMYRADRGAP